MSDDATRRDGAWQPVGPHNRPPHSDQGEAWFDRVLESIQDHAIIMLDTAGLVTRWTVGATAIIGYTAQEMLGRSAAVIFTEEDRAAGVPERELAQAAVKGTALDERWHQRKDGTRFWASGTMNALRARDGAVTGFVKILCDHTGQKELTSHLQMAKSTAEAANKSKDHFIATISHELRTPLSIILMWAKLLQRDVPPGHELRHAIDAIARNAAAQCNLIEDLLDSSRIASGKLRLHMEPTSIGELVTHVVQAFRPTMDAKGIRCHLVADPGVGIVLCDRERLEQVMRNLLSNAVKFTPEHGEITVDARRQGGGVEIVIQDTGAGIDPAFLPSIFERFTQADASCGRAHAGLGLGLSIVKSIVELHDGTAQVESDGPGRGARVTVRLPLCALPEVLIEPKGPPQPERLDARRVLVVDDQPDAGEVIAATLRRAGAEVVVANSARGALGLLEAHRPEVVVSDLGMPDMDGFEFLRQARIIEARLERPATPWLALTAFGDKETHQRAVASGFTAFMVKPSDPDMLIVEIARIIGAQRPADPGA